ncbi:MAG: YciI family protein [Nakamurella sp.]
MEYMILIHSDETYETPAPGTPGFDEMMAGWLAYNQQLIDGGHWIAAANLQPTMTATTISKVPGAPVSVTDGPYVETKEQLGGFYLITATDLDEALALAEAIPIPAGSIEVRPVAFRPDAP